MTIASRAGIGRVLLVGQADATRSEVAGRLREAGYSVHESGHAGDALHNMGIASEAAMPFDLIIVDEALSGIDAELFASLVRDDARFDSIALLLHSRNSETNFDRYGAAGYAGLVDVTVDTAILTALLDSMDETHEDGTAGQPGSTERESVGDSHGASILLVEDNEINMEVAVEMIESIGHSCDRSMNGFEAVEAVKRGRYGLVLMDCQMPRMDGYEATRRIRTWESNTQRRERVPIVAVTAHAMKGDRERCLDAGMDDYLTKPVEADELAAAIEKWLTSKSPAQ